MHSVHPRVRWVTREPSRAWAKLWFRTPFVGALLLVLFATDARAFGYVVQQGDTLAGLAERFYGKVEFETVLVVANRLEARIVPGMLLEIPAVRYRRTERTDSWEALARELLGASERSVVLADANGTKPWLAPEQGAEIVVPFNLYFTATGKETIVDVAKKFLGSPKKAWTLAHYNGLESGSFEPGQALLIPLVDLTLTAAGQEAARTGALATSREGGGSARAVQQEADRELPQLSAAVRRGNYAEAISLGSRLVANPSLAERQRVEVLRRLVEAFVAVGSTGQAVSACQEWLALEPRAKLDRARTSPKILSVCREAKKLLNQKNEQP